MASYIYDPIEHVQECTLKNGLRIVLFRMPHLNFVNLELKIHVGSMQDPADMLGLAHQYEHLACLGYHLHAHMDKIDEDFAWFKGAFDNAYTNVVNTFYRGIVPTAKIDKALKALVYLTFCPRVAPEKFLTSERKAVVREYWEDYDGNRTRSLIHDRILKKVFAGTLITDNVNVLGKPETLANIKPRDIILFREQFYHPENATLICVGGISMPVLRKAVTHAMARVETSHLAVIPQKNISELKIPTRFGIAHEKHTSRDIFGKKIQSEEPCIDIFSVDDEGPFGVLLKNIVSDTLLRELRFYKSLVYSSTVEMDTAACYKFFEGNVQFSRDVPLDKMVRIIKNVFSDPERTRKAFEFKKREELNSYFMYDWNSDDIIGRLSDHYSLFGRKIPFTEQYKKLKALNFPKFSNLWETSFAGRNMIVEYDFRN